MNVEIGNKLTESNIFWLKKRLLFNIIVGVSGLISVSKFFNMVTVFDVLGIIIWGIVANALYSFGYVAESVVIDKTNGRNDLKKFRILLFWIGTSFYVIATVLYTHLYYYSILTPD